MSPSFTPSRLAGVRRGPVALTLGAVVLAGGLGFALTELSSSDEAPTAEIANSVVDTADPPSLDVDEESSAPAGADGVSRVQVGAGVTPEVDSVADIDSAEVEEELTEKDWQAISKELEGLASPDDSAGDGELMDALAEFDDQAAAEMDDLDEATTDDGPSFVSEEDLATLNADADQVSSELSTSLSDALEDLP